MFSPIKQKGPLENVNSIKS